MKKIPINDYMTIFQFPEHQGNNIGMNITVIEENNECVIIDAGYERHMRELKDYFENKEIKYFVLTHFHPDHSYGLHELPRQSVVGSVYSSKSITDFDDEDDDSVDSDDKTPELVPDEGSVE